MSDRTNSPQKSEVDHKLTRLRAAMDDNKVDALVLRQTANIAWLTAGASTYIHQATDTGPVYLIVTREKAYAITDTIETPRLRDEEALADRGFEFHIQPWYSPSSSGPLEFDLDLKLAQDGPGDGKNFAAEMQRLRTHLQAEEVNRLRQAGKLAGEAMDEAIRAVRPGDTEFAVAGRLAAAAFARGGLPVVNLIASDERIFQYRHPLPTAKKVEKYAMLVLCFRYYGLVVSVTRLVHFGPLPNDLKAKAAAAARVDARMILGTQIGRTLSDMFELTKKAYADEGFPEAIEEHHQGGSAGYSPREVLAMPGSLVQVAANQAFAWNPSIRGVKSEDTILVTTDGLEVVTVIPGWPTENVMIEDGAIARPAILEL